MPKPPKKPTNKPTTGVSLSIAFEDNSLLSALYGQNNAHLVRIEKELGITTGCRGNVVGLTGPREAVDAGKQVLESLYRSLEKGRDVGVREVDAAIRMATYQSAGDTERTIRTPLKEVRAYTQPQNKYIEALNTHEMVFALGPAGTGKTYLAVAKAVSLFASNQVDRLVLSRPAVEAGEKLGFLPGDLKEKVDPYLRPLYDALYTMLPAEKLTKYFELGKIEIAPLAFMRGRTLERSFIILDEAQNTTPAQMKMFLTRFGEGSRMVVTGDLSQTDLPREVTSGLKDAVMRLEKVQGIATVRFSDTDIVRHPLVGRIVRAYSDTE